MLNVSPPRGGGGGGGGGAYDWWKTAKRLKQAAFCLDAGSFFVFLAKLISCFPTVVTASLIIFVLNAGPGPILLHLGIVRCLNQTRDFQTLCFVYFEARLTINSHCNNILDCFLLFFFLSFYLFSQWIYWRMQPNKILWKLIHKAIAVRTFIAKKAEIKIDLYTWHNVIAASALIKFICTRLLILLPVIFLFSLLSVLSLCPPPVSLSSSFSLLSM